MTRTDGKETGRFLNFCNPAILLICLLQGKLKILLSSDVSEYTISFTTDLPVTNLNFWEGQLTGSGASFSLQSPSYFAGKREGEYLEHGFQLSYSGNTEPKFTSITFNGVDLCSGGSAGSATEATQTATGGATEPGTSGPGAVTGGPTGGCLKDKIYYDHGEVTAYGNNPTGGHCGFTELPSAEARKHFVAISSQDAEGWKDGLYCGSCVRLRYTDGHVSQIIFTLYTYSSYRNSSATSTTPVPHVQSTTGTSQITCT